MGDRAKRSSTQKATCYGRFYAGSGQQNYEWKLLIPGECLRARQAVSQSVRNNKSRRSLNHKLSPTGGQQEWLAHGCEAQLF